MKAMGEIPPRPPSRRALLFGAAVACSAVVACASVLGVESISVTEAVGTDGGTGPVVTADVCKFGNDCPSIETVPPNCAVAECVAGACVYKAADRDGDGHAAARCVAVSGASITVGDDCDDGNANLFGGSSVDCAEKEDGTPITYPGGAPVGACRLGKKSCNPDGTVGKCVGAVAPQPVTSCTETIDEGCTGNPFESCPCTTGQTIECGSSSTGACKKGTASCTTGNVFGPCVGNIEPGQRNCGANVDNNCNGTADPAEAECKCTGGVAPGGTRACNTHPQDGTGACRAGSQTCTPTGATSMFSACTGDVGPTAEQCDGIDRDCNGTLGVNEPAPPAPAGTMNCTKIFACPAPGRGPMYYRTGIGWTNYAGGNTIWTGYAPRGDLSSGTAPPGHYRISRDGTGTKMGPVTVASACCGASGCPSGNIYFDGAGQFYTPPP